MLETFLGSKGFNDTSLAMINDPTPHILQMRQQALRVCNFVMEHLSENPLRMEEVHRAQNTFCLRARLLRSLQEAGGWEDLVDGIEIGINTTLTSVPPKKATLDDLLLQVHGIGTSICSEATSETSSRNGSLSPHDCGPPAPSVGHEGSDVSRCPEAPEWRILQPTLLLFPEEALRLLLMLWPSTHGSLPCTAVSTAPGNSGDDARIERLKASTNATTSRLLRTWATRVQHLLESNSPTPQDHAVPATVPASIFQATRSLAVLAEYLALSLSPTAMSYNDLGVLLSSLNNQPGVSRSSKSSSQGGITGHDLSRVYFEAGLEAHPHNVHLLTNLGSYWKKERDYEEAIRFVSSLLQTSGLTS